MTGTSRRSGSAPQAAPPGRDRRRLRVVLLLAMLAVLALVISRPWVRRVVPDEILGVWTTRDSAYAGRALEIQPGALLFHGPMGAAPLPVRRVSRDVQGARVRYRIAYEVTGTEAELGFTYAPSAAAIKLDSRPTMLWRRVGARR